jgi:hypothetical protein
MAHSWKTPPLNREERVWLGVFAVAALAFAMTWARVALEGW